MATTERSIRKGHSKEAREVKSPMEPPTRILQDTLLAALVDAEDTLEVLSRIDLEPNPNQFQTYLIATPTTYPIDLEDDNMLLTVSRSVNERINDLFEESSGVERVATCIREPFKPYNDAEKLVPAKMMIAEGLKGGGIRNTTLYMYPDEASGRDALSRLRKINALTSNIAKSVLEEAVDIPRKARKSLSSSGV